jgi:hypothetical protein
VDLNRNDVGEPPRQVSPAETFQASDSNKQSEHHSYSKFKSGPATNQKAPNVERSSHILKLLERSLMCKFSCNSSLEALLAHRLVLPILNIVLLMNVSITISNDRVALDAFVQSRFSHRRHQEKTQCCCTSTQGQDTDPRPLCSLAEPHLVLILSAHIMVQL